MTITVIPRHPALGAEIRRIDMRRPLDSATVQAVRDAWMKHLVLVFPGKRITDQEDVAFTRRRSNSRRCGCGTDVGTEPVLA